MIHKSEIRNPKSETNSKPQIQMIETQSLTRLPFRIWDFAHSCLFRISDFVLRIFATRVVRSKGI